MTWTANWWFINTIFAWTIAWKASFGKDILIGSWRAAGSTGVVSRIKILVRGTCGLWTVLPRVSRQAITDTSSANTILTAPISACLSWIDTVIIKVWTLKITSQSTDCLSGTWFRFKTADRISSHGKSDRICTCYVKALVRITSWSALFWDWRCTESTCYTESTRSVLFKSELLKSIITLIGVDTVVVLSPHAATVCH